MARLIKAKSLQGAREEVQGFLAGIRVPLARRDLLVPPTRRNSISSAISGGGRSTTTKFRSTSSGMDRSGEVMTMNFWLVEAEVVEVAQTAANGSGILQWLVKILEVEDAAFGMRGDEIQGLAGIERGSLGLILARQTLGETPGPYRNRDGGS